MKTTESESNRSNVLWGAIVAAAGFLAWFIWIGNGYHRLSQYASVPQNDYLFLTSFLTLATGVALILILQSFGGREFRPSLRKRIIWTNISELLAVSLLILLIADTSSSLLRFKTAALIGIVGAMVVQIVLTPRKVPMLLPVVWRMIKSRTWRRRLRKSFLLCVLVILWVKMAVDLYENVFDRLILVRYFPTVVVIALFLAILFFQSFSGGRWRRIILVAWYCSLIASLVIALSSRSILDLGHSNSFLGAMAIWSLQFGPFSFWIMLLVTYALLQIEFNIVQSAHQLLLQMPVWRALAAFMGLRWVRFTIAAGIILLLTGAISDTSLLDPVKLRENGLKLYFHYGTSDYAHYEPVAVIDQNVEKRGYSFHQFLTYCDTLVPRLERDSVKVVIVGLRENEPTFDDSISVTAVRRLARSPIVLFAVQPEGSNDGHWVQHPVLDSYGIKWWTVGLLEGPGGLVNEYSPYVYRHQVTGKIIPDLLFGVLSRYFDDQRIRTPELSGHHVVAGPISICISKRRNAPIDYNVLSNLGAPFIEQLYSGLTLKGKIVLLEWKYPKAVSNLESGVAVTIFSYFGRYSLDLYIPIIEGIISHRMIVPLDWWTPFLNGVLVLLGLIFFIRYPNRVAIPMVTLLMPVVFVCAFVIARWYSFDLPLSETLFTLVLCMAVFPFVRIVDDRRTAEKRQRQLEEAERIRLEEELRTAHDLQMGLMPSADPIIDGFDISGICRPAEQVGGDFYDYVWLDQSKTKLGIAIADVSGKAMKAAMTAVMTSGMVYREVGSNKSPKTILSNINRPMYLKTDRGMFTAMSFAVIDTKTKELVFSNAGQSQPMMLRKRVLSYIKVKGSRLPLGVMEELQYQEVRFKLKSADILLLYTDGLPEAMNATNELLGFERLEFVVRESSSEVSAKQVAMKIVERIEEFAGSAKQHDDMTVVVVRVL